MSRTVLSDRSIIIFVWSVWRSFFFRLIRKRDVAGRYVNHVDVHFLQGCQNILHFRPSGSELGCGRRAHDGVVPAVNRACPSVISILMQTLWRFEEVVIQHVGTFEEGVRPLNLMPLVSYLEPKLLEGGNNLVRPRNRY